MTPAPRISNTVGSVIRWDHQPLTVEVWPDVPIHLVAACWTACERWNDATQRHAYRHIFRVCGYSERLDVAFQLGDAWYTEHKTMDSGDILVATITIASGLDFWPSVQACKHELGHALGLAHDDQTPRALMYPKLGTRRQPLKREVLTAVGGLG